jgi:hypothetical protein
VAEVEELKLDLKSAMSINKRTMEFLEVSRRGGAPSKTVVFEKAKPRVPCNRKITLSRQLNSSVNSGFST